MHVRSQVHLASLGSCFLAFWVRVDVAAQDLLLQEFVAVLAEDHAPRLRNFGTLLVIDGLLPDVVVGPLVATAI